MVDEESIRQRREISGDTVLLCDGCGQPIDPSAAHVLVSEPAEPDQPGAETWLCSACWEAYESGESEAEPEVDLELAP